MRHVTHERFQYVSKTHKRARLKEKEDRFVNEYNALLYN
jgi:hypothetical protein